QDGLAVEMKAAEFGIGLERVDQGVDHRHQPRAEDGARLIPLAIPVGMEDQVEGRHRTRRRSRTIAAQCAGGSLAGNDSIEPSLIFFEASAPATSAAFSGAAGVTTAEEAMASAASRPCRSWRSTYCRIP